MSEKILYFYYIPDINNSRGVFNKLLSQIKSSEYTNISFLILTCDRIDIKFPNVYIEYVSKDKFKRLKEVAYFLEKYSAKYKYILFRKFVFNPFLLNTFKRIVKNGNKIVTEHHTKEIPEYLSKREFKKVFFESYGRFYMKIFNLVYKVVGVTNEIVKYETSIYKTDGFILGNGILFDETMVSGFKKFDGKNIELVVSIGDYYPWHGIERLIKSIYKCKYFNIKLNILTGTRHPNIENLHKNKFVNIFYHLSDKETKNVYKNSNLAISSLAVYKKNLKEATPLKSRDYIQRGIPFIYAYDDPDLDNSKISKYLLKVPNNESLIDFNKVALYLKTLRPEHSKELIDFAKNNLSWKYKLSQLEGFICS